VATFQRRKIDDLEVVETAMRRREKNRRIPSSRKSAPAGGAIAGNCDLRIDGFV
jgi:hypothetical protein